MKKPGYFILTPLAGIVWRLHERYGLPLPGRLVPIVFGLMIGSWPSKVKG